MSDSVGAAVVSLCSLASRLLGWRPDHFWASTPAEFANALAPSGATPASLDRGELKRMMELDHD